MPAADRHTNALRSIPDPVLGGTRIRLRYLRHGGQIVKRRLNFAAAATCLAFALLAGCASVHHGGGSGVTATGHAEWVGGPSGTTTQPASGISYKVLANGTEMEEGVTDSEGDFSVSSRDGAYVFSASGCLDLPFTIPTHEQLAVTCPMQ
jgi:hypothetical protein